RGQHRRCAPGRRRWEALGVVRGQHRVGGGTGALRLLRGLRVVRGQHSTLSGSAEQLLLLLTLGCLLRLDVLPERDQAGGIQSRVFLEPPGELPPISLGHLSRAEQSLNLLGKSEKGELIGHPRAVLAEAGGSRTLVALADRNELLDAAGTLDDVEVLAVQVL